MMTADKNETIQENRTQLILSIPGLGRRELRQLEESYLFVNFYDYISNMGYDNRIELNRQINVMRKLTRNLRNNDITHFALYVDSDKMIPQLDRYISKYNGIVNRPLPPLVFPGYAYLVRQVELFSLTNSHIEWNQDFKLLLASYLVNYIRVRRGSNDAFAFPSTRNFAARTYTHYKEQLDENPKQILEIDQDLRRCLAQKIKRVAFRYAKRVKTVSPRAYFPEVGVQ
jgi:hypothetical protein